MTYSEQATLTQDTFITALLFNMFGTNIIDHNSRLNALISGGGSTNVTIGMVFMWFGVLTDLSDTWHVCDGTGGTPDLRDVMILGAGNTYSVGQTGGMATHNHAMGDTGSGGGHSHSYSFTTGQGGDVVIGITSPNTSYAFSSHTHAAPSKTTGSVSTHTHGIPDTDNGNSLPPYKALYYIMRVK